MDLGQVYSQHAIERRTNFKVRRVHLFGPGPNLGQTGNVVPVVAFEVPERNLQLSVALHDFELVKVEQRKRLAQREDVFIAPVSGQGGTDCLCAGMTPNVTHLGKGGGVALAVGDGPDNTHARGPGDVGDDVVQLHIHLHQRLLHVLNMRCRVLDQSLTLPHIGAQRGDPGLRAKTASQETVAVQPLKP